MMTIIIEACRKDVVFAIDSSGSVGQTNFQTSLQFIGGIFNLLPIGNNDTLTALITFDSKPKVYYKKCIITHLLPF